MPRLQGATTQRSNLDIWDSFTPADLSRERCTRALFTATDGRCVIEANFVKRTNHHTVLRTWYARTDISLDQDDLRRAFEAWTHSTVVTLIVGQRIVLERPLSDLFRLDAPGFAGNRASADFTPIARRIYDAYRDQVIADLANERGLSSSSRGTPRLLHEEPPPWEQLPEREIRAWLAAARSHDLSVPISVEAQASLYVTLNTDEYLLQQMLAKLAKLENDRPLIWINLSGVAQMSLY